MDVERVHISPVAPDRGGSGRYGSADERARRDREKRRVLEKEATDRLEISKRGRETYRAQALPPDMDFARKALDRLPASDPERTAQLAARLETGYYLSSAFFEQLVARVAAVR